MTTHSIRIAPRLGGGSPAPAAGDTRRLRLGPHRDTGAATHANPGAGAHRHPDARFRRHVGGRLAHRRRCWPRAWRPRGQRVDNAPWTAPPPPSNRLPRAGASSSTSSPRGDRPAAARLARWTPSTTTTRTMSKSSASPSTRTQPRWTRTPGARATTGSSLRPSQARCRPSTSARRRRTSASRPTAPSSPAAVAAPARTGPASSTN